MMSHLAPEARVQTDDQAQLTYARDFVIMLGEAVKATSDDFESAHHVSPVEARILRLLAGGDLIVKRIGAQMPGVPLSTLTRLLDGLEARGYVTRTVNRDDRRSFMVSITDAGKAVVQVYLATMGRIAALMLEPLTTAERLIMMELMRKVEARMGGERTED